MILAHLVAVAAGILLNALAFTANAGILWVVLRNKTLRKAPTSVFLLNLCFSDLFIALLLIPVALTVLVSTSLEDNGILVPTYVCGPLSFIHSLLVYSGAWAAAAISVDRRFSIVAPMAHAAFMTTRRALLAVVMVWTMAAAFALMPHIFPSDNSNRLFNTNSSYTATAMYIFVSSSSSSSVASVLSNSTSGSAILTDLSAAAVNRSSSASSLYLMSVNASVSTYVGHRQECHMWKSCALMFALDWSDKGHVFSVAVGCYLIPTLIMISMYLSIFKVARKAGLQVHPSNPAAIPTVSNELEERDKTEKRIPEEETKDDEDGPHGKESETEEVVIEREVNRVVPETTLGDPSEDKDTKIETNPSSAKVREISLEVEASRHCIFRHLFSNEKKNDRGTPFEPEGAATGDPSKDLTCPECSSKSCLARWRSGSKFSLECGPSDPSGSKGVASSVVAGGKARRTLLLILGLSLASWTPYYIVHAYCSCTNDCWKDLPVSKYSCPKENAPHDYQPAVAANAITPFSGLGINPSCNISCTSGMFPVSFLLYRRSYIVSVVAWLLFLSSAINPILYGLLNRPVREQVVLRASATSAFCTFLFCRYFCRLCGDHGNPDGKDMNHGREEEDDGVEDFLQFLERTSSLSDTPTSRSSILQNDKV